MSFLSRILPVFRGPWEHYKYNSQFRNSLYIMMATGVMSAFGFVFWIICSRLYTPEKIGLATSLISAASLLTTLSLFGLNNVIIRFLPASEDKNKLIVSSFSIVTAGSIIASSLFLIWAYVSHSPIVTLAPVEIIVPIFILYIFLQSSGIVLEGVFVAFRDAKYILFKNTIFSIVKIVLPFCFAFLGAIGIVYSIASATLVAWIAGLIFLCLVIDVRFVMPSKAALSGVTRFASGNYFGNIFSLLPASLLPLIIASRLGAKEAAFFYMPLMIIALVNVIPSANAQSLFAEASHSEDNLATHLREAFKNLFIILTPIVIVIGLFGHLILAFFGPQYTQAGATVLQILVVASFIGSLNYFGDTLLNIKKRSGLFIAMNAFNALVIVILAYYAAPFGLVAVALSSLIGQIVTLVAYAAINRALIRQVFYNTQSTT